MHCCKDLHIKSLKMHYTVYSTEYTLKLNYFNAQKYDA